MTEEEAKRAIIRHWEHGDVDADVPGWTSLRPTVPFVTRNEAGSLAAPWVRITIKHTSSQQITQGQAPYRKWERRGWIAVQLFVDLDIGDELLSQLADDARKVLEGRSIAKTIGSSERVATYEGITDELDDANGLAGAIVRVPFRYIETR